MLIRLQCPILMGGLACFRQRWGIQQKVFWVRDNPVPEANSRKDRNKHTEADRQEGAAERKEQTEP